MYKNTICFFSFPFLIQNVHMERESQRRLSLHIRRGNGRVLLWSLLAFLLCSAWVEIFPGLYNFPDAHIILIISPAAYTMHVDMSPSSMPSTQFKQHFFQFQLISTRAPTCCLLWETGVLPVVFSASSVWPFWHATHAIYDVFPLGHCVLFTLGNRCISCYDTHAIYVACIGIFKSIYNIMKHIPLLKEKIHFGIQVSSSDHTPMT